MFKEEAGVQVCKLSADYLSQRPALSTHGCHYTYFSHGISWTCEFCLQAWK